MGVGTAAGITGRELAALAAAHFLDRRTFLGKLWQLRPPRFLDLFGPSGSLIQPERIVDLVLPDHLPETFEGLGIPFTAVAADYYGWREVRLTAGDLRSAIAGSIAIPGLFRPVMRDDVVLVDGSIVNPMPFDVLPEDLDLVIAVDVVNGPSRRGKRLIPPPRRALFGSIQILMQAVVQEKLRRRQPDVVLRPDINRFGVLDFLKAREILAAAEPLRESAKRTIAAAIEARLAAPPAALPSAAAPIAEEVSEECRGVPLGEAGDDLRRVVAGRRRIEPDAVLDRAALRIAGAVIEAADAGERDRPGAHRARLQGDVEIAADEPFRAEDGGGGADCEDLRMGGRIAVGERAVAGGRDHRTVAHHDRADGHFAPFGGGAGGVERAIHEAAGRCPCRLAHSLKTFQFRRVPTSAITPPMIRKSTENNSAGRGRAARGRAAAPETETPEVADAAADEKPARKRATKAAKAEAAEPGDAATVASEPAAKAPRARAKKAEAVALAEPVPAADADAAKPAKRSRAKKAEAETAEAETAPVAEAVAEDKPARKPRAKRAAAPAETDAEPAALDETAPLGDDGFAAFAAPEEAPALDENDDIDEAEIRFDDETFDAVNFADEARHETGFPEWDEPSEGDGLLDAYDGKLDGDDLDEDALEELEADEDAFDDVDLEDIEDTDLADFEIDESELEDLEIEDLDDEDDAPAPSPKPQRRPVSRDDGEKTERIAKVLARVGLCSRREAEDWILAGRVSVNGTRLDTPAFNVGPNDKVTVDGRPIPARSRPGSGSTTSRAGW